MITSEETAQHARNNRRKQFQSTGYMDSHMGVYFPEHYAKGWARDAYRAGKDQRVAEQEAEA